MGRGSTHTRAAVPNGLVIDAAGSRALIAAGGVEGAAGNRALLAAGGVVVAAGDAGERAGRQVQLAPGDGGVVALARYLPKGDRLLRHLLAPSRTSLVAEAGGNARPPKEFPVTLAALGVGSGRLGTRWARMHSANVSYFV